MSNHSFLDQKKPINIAKYLVLKDLIYGVDVRAKVDFIWYLTSRIENIKNELKKEGLEFQEEITKHTAYSYYKPYLLVQSISNMRNAKELLNKYESKEILEFLSKRKMNTYEL